MAEVSLLKLASDERHFNLANVDPDPCCHMALQGHKLSAYDKKVTLKSWSACDTLYEMKLDVNAD